MTARLSNDIVAAAKAVAASERVDPAGVLAFVDTESAGKPYEPADVDASDGRDPLLLFERHQFHRQLKAQAPGLLKRAVREGLAHPDWRPKSQYADQRTSEARLALLARARALHDEAALDSTSMGLMQVCGFNAEACGYPNAAAMREAFARGGVEEQLRAGIRFLRAKGLLAPLAARDWQAVARGYNGKGFKKNAYDTKLAAAFARWSTALRAPEAARPAAPGELTLGAAGPRVRALQEALVRFGVPVKTDADYGPATRRAVAAAQVELGLPGTGVADTATVEALDRAEPLARGAREVATAQDLREQGSRTVQAADAVKAVAAGGTALTVASEVLTAATDTADKAKGAVESVSAAADGLGGLATWAAAHWPVAVLALVLGATWLLAGRVIRARVEDYRTGRHV